MDRSRHIYDLARGAVNWAVFIDRALERALRFRAYETWATSHDSLEELVQLLETDVLFDSWQKDSELLVLDLPHATAMLILERKPEATSTTHAHVYADSRRGATLEMARIKELLPPAEEPSGDLIKVGFWYRGSNGPRIVHRNVDALAWSDARSNYPATTREALEASMSDALKVFAGGRLMLWHGPPGTGKTSALRTFARENRSSIAIEYVLDPEALFGHDAGYFVSVLFNNTEDDGEEVAVTKPRVLVLEDCDELLSADAKERSGQGLARLLNLVDGLIGQGLKVNVLITTNEPLGGFHPAVSRPGRCGAAISFDVFRAEECTAWLARQGSDASAPRAATLAELFSIRDGRQPAELREPIGFAFTR